MSKICLSLISQLKKINLGPRRPPARIVVYNILDTYLSVTNPFPSGEELLNLIFFLHAVK